MQLVQSSLKIKVVFTKNPTYAYVFLPQCPMSEYKASAPVVHKNESQNENPSG
jgi:hypothetical protein